MSCYGEVRRGGDRKRDRQEALQSTIVIEAIPRYPPQRVLRAAVIPRGGTGRASLNFHTKRDTTAFGVVGTPLRREVGEALTLLDSRPACKEGSCIMDLARFPHAPYPLAPDSQTARPTDPLMERRTFMALVSGGLLAAPIAAEAQQAGKVFQVGFLGTATPSLMSAWLTAFREGLRERGYVEGKNISMQYRWGEGKPERFPGLAAELVGLKVDVIVTSGPHAIRAAQRATSTIPIVMAIVEAPAEQGFISSFARPGGNLTGLSFQDSELVTRRLQLLREAIPGIVRVAALWDSTASGPTALK